MYIYSDIVQNVYEIKNTFCKERILHEYRRVNSWIICRAKDATRYKMYNSIGSIIIDLSNNKNLSNDNNTG